MNDNNQEFTRPINIFISRPTKIVQKFEEQYLCFERYLVHRKYRPIRLGQDRYTLDAPLKGVMNLMKACRGAIILGYPQYRITAAILKAADVEQEIEITIPTPWNHIEAVLAFKQRIPVLVVGHENVAGGIFDKGVTGEYVYTTNLSAKKWYKTRDFLGVFREWENKIR
jgi:hypothetical protein